MDFHLPLVDGEALCQLCDEDPQLVSIPRMLMSADRSASTRVEGVAPRRSSRAHRTGKRSAKPVKILRFAWRNLSNLLELLDNK